MYEEIKLHNKRMQQNKTLDALLVQGVLVGVGLYYQDVAIQIFLFQPPNLFSSIVAWILLENSPR